MALTDAEQQEILQGIRKMKPGIVLPARSGACNPKQDDEFGSSLNAWAEAANARAAIEALASRLTVNAPAVSGTSSLTDADVSRIASAVVRLLGAKTSA